MSYKTKILETYKQCYECKLSDKILRISSHTVPIAIKNEIFDKLDKHKIYKIIKNLAESMDIFIYDNHTEKYMLNALFISHFGLSEQSVQKIIDILHFFRLFNILYDINASILSLEKINKKILNGYDLLDIIYSIENTENANKSVLILLITIYLKLNIENDTLMDYIYPLVKIIRNNLFAFADIINLDDFVKYEKYEKGTDFINEIISVMQNYNIFQKFNDYVYLKEKFIKIMAYQKVITLKDIINLFYKHTALYKFDNLFYNKLFIDIITEDERLIHLKDISKTEELNNLYFILLYLYIIFDKKFSSKSTLFEAEFVKITSLYEKLTKHLKNEENKVEMININEFTKFIIQQTDYIPVIIFFEQPILEIKKDFDFDYDQIKVIINFFISVIKNNTIDTIDSYKPNYTRNNNKIIFDTLITPYIKNNKRFNGNSLLFIIFEIIKQNVISMCKFEQAYKVFNTMNEKIPMNNIIKLFTDNGYVLTENEYKFKKLYDDTIKKIKDSNRMSYYTLDDDFLKAIDQTGGNSKYYYKYLKYKQKYLKLKYN